MVTGRRLVLHGSADGRTNPERMNEHSRADMHVHSTASELSKLGIQRSLHLPECATPPEEVYELAKRRGMDYVTITDHNTIARRADDRRSLRHLHIRGADGVLQGGAQAVHVLCYGATPPTTSGCRPTATMSRPARRTSSRHEITAGARHPFFAVGAPLTTRATAAASRSCSRSGRPATGRAREELNLPGVRRTSRPTGKPAIGGSMTTPESMSAGRSPETPRADTPAEFLAQIRAGRAAAHGAQGSAAKWTARRNGARDPQPRSRRQCRAPRRDRRPGDRRARDARRRGPPRPASPPTSAPRIARAAAAAPGWPAWKLRVRRAAAAAGTPGWRPRPPRPVPPRTPDPRTKLARAVDEIVVALTERRAQTCPTDSNALFDACLPAIPYAAAPAFLGRERLKLTRSDGDRPRSRWSPTGSGSMHGVTHTTARRSVTRCPGL